MLNCCALCVRGVRDKFPKVDPRCWLLNKFMVAVTFWSSDTLFQTRWVYDTDFWLKDLLWLLKLIRDFFCFCFFAQYISIWLDNSFTSSDDMNQTKYFLWLIKFLSRFYKHFRKKSLSKDYHLLGRDFFLIFHSVYTLYNLITVKNVSKCFLEIL